VCTACFVKHLFMVYAEGVLLEHSDTATLYPRGAMLDHFSILDQTTPLWTSQGTSWRSALRPQKLTTQLNTSFQDRIFLSLTQFACEGTQIY